MQYLQSMIINWFKFANGFDNKRNSFQLIEIFQFMLQTKVWFLPNIFNVILRFLPPVGRKIANFLFQIRYIIESLRIDAWNFPFSYSPRLRYSLTSISQRISGFFNTLRWKFSSSLSLHEIHWNYQQKITNSNKNFIGSFQKLLPTLRQWQLNNE